MIVKFCWEVTLPHLMLEVEVPYLFLNDQWVDADVAAIC
jgi:hypothetical protein